MRHQKTASRTIVTTLIVLVVIIGGIVLAIHNARPAKLTSNTPTSLNMGGIYTITVPCLATNPSESSNPGNLPPVEYTSSCSTNLANGNAAPTINGDSENGLPPSIDYYLSSYTNGSGGPAMTYTPSLNTPDVTGCNTSNHFLKTINHLQFDICVTGSTNSANEIDAIALNGNSEGQIKIFGGVGGSNLPSNALSDLYSTLSTFHFIN